MKKLLFSVFALVAFLSGAANVTAQQKPVAVVSFAGYDELMSDLDFIGQITGIPDLSAQKAEEHLKEVTQGQGLKGLDKKKPWGAAVFLNGLPPKFVVFFPISDIKGFVEAFAGGPVPFSVKDVGKGVFEVRSPAPQPGFAKSQGNYTFFAQSASDFADLPQSLLQNPEAALDGMNKDYDFAVRAYIQNIPQAFRNQALGLLQMGMQASLNQPNPGEDPEAFELRKKLVEQQVKQMETLFKELDTFTIGAKIDGAAKTAHLDFGLTVTPNSEMAKQLAKATDLKTNHGGFLLPDAAFNMTMVGIIEPADAKQAETMIKSVEQQAKNQIDNDNSFPDAKTRDTAKEIIADLVSVGVKTIQAGRIDAGATVFLAPQSATLVLGGTVVDAATVESALKKFVEMAKGEIPGEVKFNAGKINDVTLHTLSIPVPDAGAQKVFGEAADVVVGIGSKSVHLAFGRNAADALKKVLDKSAADGAKAVPPFQAIVALAPILTFANSIEPNPQLSPFTDTLSASGGKDHVSLVANVQKNGFIYRLKAEEGVLKSIGVAARMAMGGGGF